MIWKFNVKKSEIERIIKNPLLLYAEFLKIGKGKFYIHGIKRKRTKKGDKHERNRTRGIGKVASKRPLRDRKKDHY